MNKFNLGLHSALFDPDKQEWSSLIEAPRLDLTDLPEVKSEVIIPTQEKLTNLKRPLTSLEQKIQGAMTEFDSEYFNFSNKVGLEIQQLRADRHTLSKEQLSRVRDRHRENTLLWNQNVRKWYEHLLNALAKKWYFMQENAKNTQDIQEMYIDSVSRQYEENVWDSRDEEFKNLKEKLFTADMGDSYPANEVYKKLTKASSIFAHEREHTEWHRVDVLRGASTSVEWAEERETASDRDNRNFLAFELPNYLRNIVKNGEDGQIDKWGISSLNLPFLIWSASLDKPSWADLKAIRNFLKATNKIEVTDGRDPAVALLEALHDNRINTDTTSELYRGILESHGIKLKSDKYLKDLVEVWNFYIWTQLAGNSEREQHAIYLSILGIIENEWWIANAVNKFKPVVEEAKAEKKQEMDQKFGSWEVLQAENEDLYDLAKNKLRLSNFAAATRLAYLAKNNPDYFKNNPVEKILGNLNNDQVMGGDETLSRWLKSGSQFERLFNQIWKEKAFSHLLQRAKTRNSAWWLWLDESIFDPEKAEEEIKWWNVKLILLLQSIISNPGIDLFKLLWGVESETGDPFEWQDLNEIDKEWQAKQQAFEEAWRILNEKAFLEDYKEFLKWKDVSIEDFADLQASLASILYDNYKAWLWVGSTLTFKDWAKWIQISNGAQVRGNWLVLWLSISYSATADLWNGWSLAGGISAWIFLPIVSWKKDVFGSVWLNLSADNKRIDLKTGTVRHQGLDAGYNVVTNSLYFWWHDNRNKLEWLDESMEFFGQQFEQVVMWDVMDHIKDKLWNEKMNLDDPDTVNKVKEAIMDVVKKQTDIAESEREGVVEGMVGALTNYNNADLNQPWVKYAISKWIAEEYKKERWEKRKEEISNGVYFSWYSIWLFWKVWTPRRWAYLTARSTEHQLNWLWDKWWEGQELDSETVWEWNEEVLDRFNQQLWLSGKNALRIDADNWFVVIPSSLKYRVNVNEKMKWLMKQDENWNVLIDVHTPMSYNKKEWAWTRGSEIRIWWKDWETREKLDLVDGLWFTNGDIDQSAVLELGESIDAYTEELLNQALDSLKKKFPAWDRIQTLEVNPDTVAALLEWLNKLDRSKVAKLRLDFDNEWRHYDVSEWEEWSGLEIEYQSRFEMIDIEAKEIAQAVYAEALKITSWALHDVKHDTEWPEYADFSKAMNKEEPDYESARESIKQIFAKLDSKVSGANFGAIWAKLDEITDNNALGQALMSINNVFARSAKVIWWGSEYKFTKSMWGIIAEREGQISRTIEKYSGSNITPEAKAAYKSLIEASGKYRQNNRNLFNRMSAPAAQLNNTVWFNLWDKTNPENPLFNPEIYDPMVDLAELEKYGFSESDRSVLQERAMRLFAGNKALLNPILKYLWLDENAVVEVKEDGFSTDWKTWKLKLDIWWKIITFSAWMKFGYFTQCVNHTVILDDFSVETEDGSKVSFASDVRENGTYREWSKSSIVATASTRLGIAITTWKEAEQNTEVKTNDATTWGPGPKTTPDGTTENPTTPTTAWGGDTTISWWDEF